MPGDAPARRHVPGVRAGVSGWQKPSSGKQLSGEALQAEHAAEYERTGREHGDPVGMKERMRPAGGKALPDMLAQECRKRERRVGISGKRQRRNRGGDRNRHN